MASWADCLFKVRPWSLSAFLAAVVAVAFAAVAQEVFASLFGITLYFAAFFPAILVASLLAGAPSGALAAVLAVPVVWWAFMPPQFEFNHLTAAEYDRFVLFALPCALVICFSHLYRQAVAIQRKRLAFSEALDGRMGWNEAGSRGDRS